MKRCKTVFDPIILMGLLMLCACSRPVAVRTVYPHKGSIQKTFTELARTRLQKTYDMNMPLTGLLARIQLEPGSQVKKGQVVAYLVQKPWEEAVQAAKARIVTMHALYVNSEKLYQRQLKLSKKGFVAASDLDETLSQAQAWKAQADESKANLAIAQYHLKHSVITSPIDGVVLKRFTEGQKWLMEGAPLLQLGCLSDLEVVSEVLSQQAQQLRVGDPVVLTTTGNSTVFQGIVKRIDPAGFTKRSALGVEEQRVDVIIALKTPQKTHLGVGFRLQAKFLIGTQQKQVLIIPRFSILQDNQGQFYVFKVIKNQLKKQIIVPDIWTDQQVSVLKGLTEQDAIVAEPTAEMFDGMKIH